MKLLNKTFLFFSFVLLGFTGDLAAQNSSSAEAGWHFGQTDSRFLWGVSGGVVLPFGTPQKMEPNVKMKPGYAFGLDFRHVIGNRYKAKYLFFIHYGVRMGSFFYKSSSSEMLNYEYSSYDYASYGYNSGPPAQPSDVADDTWFVYQYEPMYLHLDIPLGFEFPLYYLCDGRLSFNFQAEITSRFYFFYPNKVYNIAATGGLAVRFDKVQLQVSYSYYILPQYARYTAPQHINWRISELNIGMKYYF